MKGGIDTAPVPVNGGWYTTHDLPSKKNGCRCDVDASAIYIRRRRLSANPPSA
jgi:hypothetical protein